MSRNVHVNPVSTQSGRNGSCDLAAAKKQGDLLCRELATSRRRIERLVLIGTTHIIRQHILGFLLEMSA